tara:strand:- start:857 stop:1201 length:345 start_codon:yes stop_codon:yes gene_type:complete
MPTVTGIDKGRQEFCTFKVYGFQVQVDVQQGHLTVAHDGSITWDQLQAIKCIAWGNEVRAIEVYPAQSSIVNSLNMRHLWRLGPHDFCPDLLGEDIGHDSLEARHAIAWAEARA